jgi:DEAD/DEAH box helicase domain-containing protein
VTDSGAPQGERHLLLWNPPVINPDLGIRASARSQTTRIARAGHHVRAQEHRLRPLAADGGGDHQVPERRLRPRPAPPPRVLAYRGGYLPSERRSTERALRAGAGRLRGQHLGAGAGRGHRRLDVAVLNGYPGTIAATWQRLGRAGRRNRPCLGVLVAGSEPLDQYMVRHPEFFLGARRSMPASTRTSC